MVIVSGFLSWATYGIYQNYQRYRRLDSTTKVSVQYNNEMPFPAVTFCNLNQWRRSALDNDTIKLLSTVYALNQTSRDAFNFTAYYAIIDKRYKTDWNMTEIALSPHSGALDLSKMLLECTWNGVEHCSYSDFKKIITDLGVCYTFNNPTNAEDARVVNIPGTDSGLTLTLDINQYDNTQGEFQGVGIKVVIIFSKH